MASENDIPLNITIETDDAKKSLKTFENDIGKTVDKSEKLFSGLKVVIAGAVAAIAAVGIAKVLNEAVVAATESDQAVRNLGVALASTGEFSAQAVKEFEAYAAEIQRTTTLQDEQVLSSISLAKTFGLTNEQAKNVTEAAIGLAAATGDDLNTATEKLAKTYSGQVGLLGKQVKGLKDLTEEQAKNGEVIDIVKKQYEDFARVQSQTFGGAVTQARNQFGEIFESIGKIITQNPIVIASINLLSKVFTELGKFIDDNKQVISDYLSEFLKGVLGTIPEIINIFKILKSALEAIPYKSIALAVGILTTAFAAFFAVLKAQSIFAFLTALPGIFAGIAVSAGAAVIPIGLLALKFAAIGAVVAGIAIGIDLIQSSIRGTEPAFKTLLDDVKNFAGNFTKSLNENGASLEGFTEESKKAKEQNKSLTSVLNNEIKSIQNLDGTLIDVTKGIKNGAKATQDLADKSKELESLKGSFEKIKGAIEPLQKEYEKQNLTTRQQIELEFKRNQEVLKNATRELELEGKLTQENIDKLNQYEQLIDKKRELASIAAPSEEFETAQKGGKEIAKDISGALTGGLSGAAGTITGALSGFTSIVGAVSGVLDTVQGIIDAIPGVLGKVAKIFDSLTDLPDAILKGIVSVFKAIPRFIAEFIPNLLKAIPDIISEVIDALSSAIPNAVTKLAESLPEIITNFISKLSDLAAPLIEALVLAMPNITNALVDAFITKGGAVKVAVALIQALSDPRLYLEMAKGLAQGFVGLGSSVANQIKAGIGDYGRKMGSDFIAAIGQFFANLLNGIKNVFAFGSNLSFSSISSAFLNAAKVIYDGITQAFNSIFNSLYTTITGAFYSIFTDLFNTISGAFYSVYSSLYDAITGGFSNSFDGIRNAIGDAANRIKDEFYKPVNRLIEFLNQFKFPDITGGSAGPGGSGIISGKVGGAIGQGAARIGLASGALVPPGFEGDKFGPVNLNSGELVLPPDISSGLLRLIANPQQSSGLSEAILMKILNAVQAPQQLNTQVVIGSREIANVILDLQRNNQRLSA